MGTDKRNTRVGRQRGSRTRQWLAVVSMLVLLAIAILALAGARRAVFGHEPKACGTSEAQFADRTTQC